MWRRVHIALGRICQMWPSTLFGLHIKHCARWALHIERTSRSTATVQERVAVALVGIPTSFSRTANRTTAALATSTMSTATFVNACIAIEWQVRFGGSGGLLGLAGGSCSAEAVEFTVLSVVAVWARAHVLWLLANILEVVNTKFKDASATVYHPK